LAGADTGLAGTADDGGSATLPVDREVDARGLNCPLPLLRAKKALATMDSGQCLRVLATDPNAVADFAAFCAHTGHTLLARTADGGTYRLVLRKA
jgi:tRNA 2-thiouridine synthesizing protein A